MSPTCTFFFQLGTLFGTRVEQLLNKYSPLIGQSVWQYSNEKTSQHVRVFNVFQIGNLFCNKLEQTFQHVFNVFVFLIAIHLAVRNNMSKLSQHGGVRGTDDFHHFINFHRKRSAKICISGVYLYPLSAFFLQPPTHVIVRRLKDMSQHYETVSIS